MRNRPDVDTALATLREELSAIEPSSGFAARVRDDVARTAIVAPRLPWVVPVAGTTALAVLMIVLASGQPRVLNPAGSEPSRNPVQAGPASPVDSTIRARAAAATPRMAKERPRATAAARPRSGAHLEIVLPADERRAMARLLATGALNLPVEPVSGRPEVDDITGALMPPPEIAIPPIRIDLLPSPNPSGGVR